MALPTNADVVVVRGFWIDETTGQGVKAPGQGNNAATITFDPVPLAGQPATITPNLRDVTFSAFLKTRQRVASVNPVTGYFATLLVANNDPDLDAYGGRKVTMLGETPFVIEVPHNAATTTVDAAMAAATELMQGSTVKAIWLVDAALVTTPAPTPTNSYLTSTQTLSTIAAGLEVHEQGSSPHPQLAALKQWAANPDALIVGTVTRDSNGAATSAGVVWPDGATGTYTATTVSSTFPGAVDAYTVTKGSATYTQPAVTRNASGAVTARPAIAVS